MIIPYIIYTRMMISSVCVFMEEVLAVLEAYYE